MSSKYQRADQTRARILRVAVREFSTHGLSGARTEAIAEAAKVNKALLYYYFRSKKELYSAAVEEVSGKVVGNALAALDFRFSPGERLLRTALTHFDRILTQREFQSLLQQEMVRYRSDKQGGLPLFFKTAFKPLFERLHETVNEGMKTGELCKMDWLQVMYSIFGANVFYFLSAPMIRLALPFNPFTASAIKSRRAAAVQFLGNALFSDRAHGMKLANRVLAETPIPRMKRLDVWGSRP